MKIWGTTIYAICAETGEEKVFCGPNVKAPKRELAHQYCQTNGLGYCHIQDELIAEIPCKKGSYEPDFDNKVDYENQQLN